MIFQLFIVTGFVALVLTLFSRSHRLMNLISLTHAAAYLVLAFYSLTALRLPVYYPSNNFFFMDSLSLFEVAIASLVFFLSILYLEGYIESLIKTKELRVRNLKFFYLITNLLLIATTCCFFSNNLALFWIFLELSTLLSAMLIVILNAREIIDVALKYVFVCSTAMLFSFLGLILLYAAASSIGARTLNWDELLLSASSLSPRLLALSFLFIFLGFAAKSGIVPFHMWLPHAHSNAPSAVSAIFAGAMNNIGIYGILRVFSLVHRSSSLQAISGFLIFMGILSICVASLNLLTQKNTKKLIAFSSIEQMGIVLVGIGIGSKVSILWALAYVLAHSLTKSLLFFCAGILNRQFESNELGETSNVMALQPLASFGLVVGSLAIVGLPPFVIFLPKFFLMVELSKVSLIGFLIAMTCIVIVSVAFAKYMGALLSRSEAKRITRYIAPAKMNLSIIFLLCLVIALGVIYPQQVSALLDAIASVVVS